MTTPNLKSPLCKTGLKTEEQTPPAIIPLIVLATLFFSFIFTAMSMQNKSVTYDEPQHYRYGVQILLHGNSERFDDSKMPLSVLNGAPRATALGLQRLFNLEEPPTFLYNMKTGRYATILVFLVLCLYVYRWSSELYGWRGGILSLYLTVFSPNLIAHARLITTDIFATATITISLYYFWQMYRKPNAGRVIKSSVALGIAQIAKYTSVFLFPILLLIATVKGIASATGKNDTSPTGKKINHIFLYIGAVLLHLSAVILIINIGFLGNQTGMPLKNYPFQSGFFQNIQVSAGPLAELPLPVPYPYLQGLDLVKDTDGNLQNNTILFNQVKTPPETFSNYYLIAFLFKVPIATQILLCWALILLLRNWRKNNFLDRELFLILPAVFLTLYFNCILNTQIGIRFILPLLPLVHILCGNIMSSTMRKGVVPLVILCGYLGLSVISWFPHYISYFNELVLDRKMSYKILADSNIDFGQNELYLQDFKNKHPDAILQPKKPVAGKLIVSANFLNPVFQQSDYRWLRDNFTPNSHIGYSHLVFDLSQQDLKKINYSQVDFFTSPESPTITATNSYYQLNNWQAYGLELADELYEAELHYRKLVEFAPDEADPYISLARISKRQGDTQKALEYGNKAQKLQDLEEIYIQGELMIGLNNYQKANQYFDAISKQRSSFRLALFYNGLTLQLQGMHKEAIPLYEQFLQNVPGYFQAHFNLGYALMKNNNLPEAIYNFEKTLAIKPDYEEAQQHLIWCQKRLQNLRE